MTIIEIKQNDNGSHNNQTINNVTPEIFPIPEGYAIIPEELGTPDTLPNYPFGEIATEIQNGIPVVTSWFPLPIPEQLIGDPQPTEFEQMRADIDFCLAMMGAV